MLSYLHLVYHICIYPIIAFCIYRRYWFQWHAAACRIWPHDCWTNLQGEGQSTSWGALDGSNYEWKRFQLFKR